MKKEFLIFSVFYFLFLSSFAQSWNSVGIPCGANVAFMKVYQGDLYAAELSFTNPCGQYHDAVGKFNGIFWDTLGIFDRVAGVTDFEEYNGELYLSGGGILSGNPWPNDWLPNTTGLAKWNGIQWMAVDSPAPGAGILALQYRGDLYMGGTFTSISGVGCKRIVRYNGSTWNNMLGGIDGSFFPAVRALAAYNGDLYVGGTFDIAGTVPVKNIARWDGTKWDSLASGVIGTVWCMLTDTINNLLYVGGSFTSAGGIPVNYIAKWDGVKWDSVGTGITANVLAMTMLNGDLYVGGGGSSYYDTVLAKWDGISWTPIVGLDGGISSLAAYKGNIYAGGPFTTYGDSVNGGFITNGLACYGDSCPLNVGIHEPLLQKLKFKVYPNPAKNNITIETEENDGFIVRISNPLGQNVSEKKFHQKTEVDVSAFGKGLFLVEVCLPAGQAGDEKGVKCHTEKVLIE